MTQLRSVVMLDEREVLVKVECSLSVEHPARWSHLPQQSNKKKCPKRRPLIHFK